ncbi:MAG: hypothetical protein K9M44_05035 [Candidatus Pacebacteria bacterium]|nr:hypothetical protein [Candidatus Paceibacterota bacterium]
MSIKKRPKKLQKKDYKDKSFENPFFKDKRQGRGSKSKKYKFKIIIFTTLIVAIVFTAIWFFYISETFKIKVIEISGELRVDKAEIENLVREDLDKKYFIFSQSNLFVFSQQDLETHLQNKYNFAKIEIEKIIPDKLVIKAVERSYKAIWFESGNYYYIDDQGFILEKINNLEALKPEDFPIIENQSSDLISDNSISQSTETLNFAIKAWQALKARQTSLVIEKFIINNEKNSLNAKLIGGPILYLNLLKEPQDQINNLIILHQEQLQADIFSLSYIDLRYDEKIFYQ